MNEDELVEKVKSYPKCDDGCEYYHHMIDRNDSGYKVAFCGYEMEAIVKGTYCAYYKRREE